MALWDTYYVFGCVQYLQRKCYSKSFLFSLFAQEKKNFLDLNREMRAIFSIYALHDSNGIDDDDDSNSDDGGSGGDGGFVFVYALLPLLLKKH